MPYEHTTCGGDDKRRDMQLHIKAYALTDQSMREDACGCDVCFADALLSNLRRYREEAGCDPQTGMTTTPAPAPLSP